LKKIRQIKVDWSYFKNGISFLLDFRVKNGSEISPTCKPWGRSWSQAGFYFTWINREFLKLIRCIKNLISPIENLTSFKKSLISLKENLINFKENLIRLKKSLISLRENLVRLMNNLISPIQKLIRLLKNAVFELKINILFIKTILLCPINFMQTLI